MNGSLDGFRDQPLGGKNLRSENLRTLVQNRAACTIFLARVDPVAVLPGTWDGWFQVVAGSGGNPHRILTIDSVTPKEDGAWTAKGRFAIAGEKAPLSDIDVTRKSDDIFLDWKWGKGQYPIHLKLVGATKMEGYWEVWRYTGGRTANTKLGAKLEKTEKAPQ